MAEQRKCDVKSKAPTIDRLYTRAPEIRLGDPVGGEMPKIMGYAALFDDPYDVGWFTERIQKGAFAESLANGDDVRALFNHDPNFVLGRRSAGTLELGEDDKGLWYVSSPPSTQWARDLVVGLRRGDIDESSFAFETIEDEWRTNDGADERILIRAKLWDVSPTTFGANANTTSAASKRSRDEWVKAHRRGPQKDIVERRKQLDELIGKAPAPVAERVMLTKCGCDELCVSGSCMRCGAAVQVMGVRDEKE